MPFSFPDPDHSLGGFILYLQCCVFKRVSGRRTSICKKCVCGGIGLVKKNHMGGYERAMPFPSSRDICWEFPQPSGFPLFSGKVLVLSRALSGLFFLVFFFPRPRKRKSANRENPGKQRREKPEKIRKVKTFISAAGRPDPGTDL